MCIIHVKVFDVFVGGGDGNNKGGRKVTGVGRFTPPAFVNVKHFNVGGVLKAIASGCCKALFTCVCCRCCCGRKRKERREEKQRRRLENGGQNAGINGANAANDYSAYGEDGIPEALEGGLPPFQARQNNQAVGKRQQTTAKSRRGNKNDINLESDNDSDDEILLEEVLTPSLFGSAQQQQPATEPFTPPSRQPLANRV